MAKCPSVCQRTLGTGKCCGAETAPENAAAFAGAQTLKECAAIILKVGKTSPNHLPKGAAVLYYAIVFFVIALIAAVLGFGGVVTAAAGIAKLLFGLFILLALVSAAIGLLRRG